MIEDFQKNGFTKVFKVNFDDELTGLQKLIYNVTKNQLIEHNTDISLEEKINLKFKEIPKENFFSDLMNSINTSSELKNVLNSKGILNSFKLIFNNPEPFDISTFRARIPNQKRTIYKWHQDEGTWHLSKNPSHINKFPATLWLSINGTFESDGIQLVRYSHKEKLHNQDIL